MMRCVTRSVPHTRALPSASRRAAASANRAAPAARFGPHEIPGTNIFAESPTSFAFVNLKPVVPGHVLVAPRRVAPRVSGLADDELADLWRLARRVGETVEAHFSATSLTFGIQDGPEAGQSVPHVHIHIMPRQEGDFEPNDIIYAALQEREKELDAAAAAGGYVGASAEAGRGSAGLGGGGAAAPAAHFDAEERRPRSREEMRIEAAELREAFQRASRE